MVFQSYALYPHMTARENLEFGLRMRGVPREEMRRRVGDAASILGIEHLLERRPKDLSGGQRQRVAVGRAIVRKPAVFLFDEPLSNLDAKLRVQMRAEITRLQQTLGTTSVYVTHDQVEAMTMGHRITVLREGKIQQVGTPGEVYDHPANVFVAQFIGTPPMNLLRGSLAEAIAKRPNVIVGIRPEYLRLGDGIPATIDMVEPIGHETIVYATADGEKLVAIFDPHEAPRAGAQVSFTVDPARLHLFDAQSEMAAR
jgi:multiple sugar transport system ATP-binding protein